MALFGQRREIGLVRPLAIVSRPFDCIEALAVQVRAGNRYLLRGKRFLGDIGKCAVERSSLGMGEYDMGVHCICR